MHALRDFFTIDYGLLNAAVIAFTLFMGFYFTRYAARHIREKCAFERLIPNFDRSSELADVAKGVTA